MHCHRSAPDKFRIKTGLRKQPYDSTQYTDFQTSVKETSDPIALTALWIAK